MTALVVTKLDVLSGLDRIQVCTSYRGAEGATFDDFPYHQTVLHHTTAGLTELPGWSEDLGECRTFSDLPERRAGVPASSSPSTSARRSRSWAWARDASRRSGPTPAERRCWRETAARLIDLSRQPACQGSRHDRRGQPRTPASRLCSKAMVTQLSDVLAPASLTHAERRVLERLVERLRDELGSDLHAIWLYGSRARGRLRTRSPTSI